MRREAGLAVLALFAGGSTVLEGQQIPVSGCGAALSCAGPRGFSTLTGKTNNNILTISSRGWQPRLDVGVNLPPPPTPLDEGAVATGAAIVLSRNRKLRENLSVASAAAAPPKAPVTPRPGEVLIRIASTQGPPPGEHREDIPKDGFGRMPLRKFAYPQWSGRER